MSIRQQIIDALQTRLSLIAVGYQFALAGSLHTCETAVTSVRQWPVRALPVASLPVIEYWDTACAMIEGSNAEFENELSVIICGYVSTGENAARALLSDITAAILTDRYYGGLADYTTIESQDINAIEEGDHITACKVQLRITYLSAYGGI